MGRERHPQKYGGRIIDTLLATGYHIIIRPHPQSFRSEQDMMAKLMRAYPDSPQLEWNRDADNYDVLRRSDILISDFSGVIFDFSLVYDKPVIYTDTDFDDAPYDAWWLDTPYWTFDVLPRIGQKLTEENMPRLRELIDACLRDPAIRRGATRRGRRPGSTSGRARATRPITWSASSRSCPQRRPPTPR